MKLLFSRISILFVLFFLTACERISIDVPTEGAVTIEKPELFAVTFSSGTPANIRFQLNTIDVTDFFTITAAGAEAIGADLAEYVFSGKNSFVAIAGIEMQQSIFYYDITGPVIHTLNTDFALGSVTGYVVDPGGVASITLDGNPISLSADNEFVATFTSAPFNVFVAIDDFGHESTTTFARSSAEDIEQNRYNASMSARLNNGGFEFLTEQVEIGLAGIDFEKAMKDLNPLFDFEVLGIGFFSVDVIDLSFDPPSVEITVNSDEHLETHIAIPNFQAGIKLYVPLFGFLGNLFSFNNTIFIENLTIDTDLILSIENADVDVAITNTSVGYGDGITVDSNLLPPILDAFVGNITNGAANAFTPTLIDIVKDLVLPAVSEFIREIPIDIEISTTDGDSLHISVLPTYLDTFEDGLTIDLNAGVVALATEKEIKHALGALYVDSDLPSLGNTTPGGNAFDFGASISVNFINQALFAAHEAGITTMNIGADNTPGTSPEGLSVILTAGDDIQPLDLISMKLLPASPPFIKLVDDDNIHGTLGWYDVVLEFDLKRNGWPDFLNLFSVTFNLEVPFELGATDDGFLLIGIEQLPTLEIIEANNIGPIQLTPKFMTSVIDYFMPIVMPALANKLKAVPLPRISGYGIYAEELWVSGTGHNNFSLAGSLVKLSVTEQASPPSSSLEFSGSNEQNQSTIASASSVSITEEIDVLTEILDPTEETEVIVENGEATITISGTNPTNSPLEYRYSVDGGDWTLWKQRNSIHLQRLLGGHHEVQVCARTVYLKQEQDCPIIEFDTNVVE